MTKRFVDPFKRAQEVEAEAKRASALADEAQQTSEVHLKDLLDKTRTILKREIMQLMIESSGGLLSKDSSQALVNYIKVLTGLIKDENELLDNMSDDELESILKDQK